MQLLLVFLYIHLLTATLMCIISTLCDITMCVDML